MTTAGKAAPGQTGPIAPASSCSTTAFTWQSDRIVAFRSAGAL